MLCVSALRDNKEYETQRRKGEEEKEHDGG